MSDLQDQPADFPGSVFYASRGPNIFCTADGRIVVAARGIGGVWESISFDPHEIPVVVERLQAGVKLSAEILREQPRA